MAVKPKFSFERMLRAPIDEVWELWTTREGIESWWGPDQFTVKVRRLEVRPGGQLVYEMTAIAPDQIEFMKKAGIPVSLDHSITYTEVEPPRRLVYRDLVDFVPGVDPYEIEQVVDLQAAGEATRLVITFDALHDEYWSKMATMGKEMELARLEKVLATRSGT